MTADAKRHRIRVPIIMASGEVVAEHDVALSELEARIFDVLRGAAASSGRKTVIRVAGGWVRDKLLRRVNHDIDIALDDCSGEVFATLLNEHLARSGETTHSVNVIHANPDQSKHLETATVNVLGMQIDCVNLRTEEYASDSRIPTTGFGTAEEDAMRRDFTINAMFFNVNDESVEDLTGHGFADLEAGIIRTPLAPRSTLLDDPLRVMRAVRFASRFGFSLAADLREAMELPEVRTALACKVSRERIGSELDGMLESARPVGALRMLEARRLLPLVLSPPRMTSLAAAEAAAAVVKAAKGHRGLAKGKGKAVPPVAASASASAGDSGLSLPASPATALAEWLMAGEPYVEGEEPEAVAQICADGMLLVDACDAVLGVLGSGAAGAAGAGASEAGSAVVDRAYMPGPSALAEEGAAPRPVVRGRAVAAEDAARDAAISAERLAAEAGAASVEAQQLRDQVGRSEHLSSKDRRMLLLALLCWPLRDAWTLGTSAKDLGKLAPAATVVLRDSLKFRVKDCTDAACIHEAVPLLLVGAACAAEAGLLDRASQAALSSATQTPVAATAASSSSGGSASPLPDAEDLASSRLATPGSVLPLPARLERAEAQVEAACRSGQASTAEERARIALGLAVRASKGLFKACVSLAAAVATAASFRAAPGGAASPHADGSSSGTAAAVSVGDNADAEALGRASRLAALGSAAAGPAAACTALSALVEELSLSDAAEWKPLVDGKALRAMGMASGPAMRPIMEAQMMWRLARPTATRAECEAAVQSWVGEA